MRYKDAFHTPSTDAEEYIEDYERQYNFDAIESLEDVQEAEEGISSLEDNISDIRAELEDELGAVKDVERKIETLGEWLQEIRDELEAKEPKYVVGDIVTRLEPNVKQFRVIDILTTEVGHRYMLRSLAEPQYWWESYENELTW